MCSLNPFLNDPLWLRAGPPCLLLPGVRAQTRARDDWRKPFLWFIVISQWGHAPGDTRRPGGRLIICLDNKQLNIKCLGPDNFAILQMRMCWYSKSAAYVLYPSLYSHHNSAHLRDLNQNICLETKSLFIVPEPLSVWRGSVSPRWRHPTFLAFFLPLPCISVSWLYWLKCSRSESVTLGDKKAVLHPAYVLIFQSTD